MIGNLFQTYDNVILLKLYICENWSDLLVSCLGSSKFGTTLVLSLAVTVRARIKKNTHASIHTHWRWMYEAFSNRSRHAPKPLLILKVDLKVESKTAIWCYKYSLSLCTPIIRSKLLESSVWAVRGWLSLQPDLVTSDAFSWESWGSPVVV